MQEIIRWMREFLILYLILTIFMQLAAAEEYKKYLRFLSGMILLLVLISPVLRFTGSGGAQRMEQSYEKFWKQMDDFTKDADRIRQQQNRYELQLYEDKVAANLTAQAQEQGMPVSMIRVTLSEDYKIQQVSVWLDAGYRQQHPQAKQQMMDFLKETCGLSETQIFISE